MHNNVVKTLGKSNAY